MRGKLCVGGMDTTMVVAKSLPLPPCLQNSVNVLVCTNLSRCKIFSFLFLLNMRTRIKHCLHKFMSLYMTNPLSCLRSGFWFLYKFTISGGVWRWDWVRMFLEVAEQLGGSPCSLAVPRRSGWSMALSAALLHLSPWSLPGSVTPDPSSLHHHQSNPATWSVADQANIKSIQMQGWSLHQCFGLPCCDVGHYLGITHNKKDDSDVAPRANYGVASSSHYFDMWFQSGHHKISRDLGD